MKITITEKQLEIEGEVSLERFMELTATYQLQMMNNILEDAPEEHKQQIKEFIFDQTNQLFSAVLDNFAPDIELRPDITEEAILKAELELHKKNKTTLDVIRKH